MIKKPELERRKFVRFNMIIAFAEMMIFFYHGTIIFRLYPE